MPGMSCLGFSPSQGVLMTNMVDDLSPSANPVATPQASSMERHLLHYYVFQMSTVLVNVDGPSNPLRSVLLPRAVTSSTLLNALYATAALHASVGDSGDSEFRIASLGYYNKAASALHHLIAGLGRQQQHESGQADLEIALLTAVYLCKYEIISGGVSNWRSHLLGVQRLFDAAVVRKERARLAPETHQYVKSFIAYHTHIAGLTAVERLSGPAPTTTDLERQEFDEATAPCKDPLKVDPYMGVSASLISLLHKAAQTIMTDPTNAGSLSLMVKAAIAIYHQLQTENESDDDDVDGATPSSHLPSELDADTITCLGHIADAYRHAVVAYLHIILDTIEAHATTDELQLQCLGLRSLLSMRTKAGAISECVRATMRVPASQSCAVGLVPLLFVAASETRERVEFDAAWLRLHAILGSACLGNIAPALELLQKARGHDSGAPELDWRQVLRDFGWDLIVT